MKKYFSFKDFAALLIISSICNCYASYAAPGGDHSGGADDITCNSSMRLADLSIVKDPVMTTIFDDYTVDQITKGLKNYLRVYRSEDFQSVESALKEIAFLSPIDLPLKNLETGLSIGFFSRVFGGCSKEQLAVQDFITGNVSIYKPIFDQLPNAEKSLFFIHEAYVRIGWKEGMSLIDAETFARNKTGSIWSDFRQLKSAFYYTLPAVDGGRALGHQAAIGIVTKCANSSRSNLARTLSQLGVVSGLGGCSRHELKNAGFDYDPSITYEHSDERLINYVTEFQNCRSME